MAFGQKTGSLRNLKKTLAKNSGGQFIKYIPKNGTLNVRFIQEPEEWVNYVEHWDAMARKSYPCSGEQSCPGCIGGERKSSRYLANAVDLDDKERVIPLQMPKDLANRLVVKYEKWGTLIDRDIELSRQGEGLDTVYDLEAEPPSKRNLAKFQPHDLLKVLEDAYNAVFGDNDDEDEDEVEKSPVRPRKKSTASRRRAAAEAEAEEDEEDEPKPAAKKAAKKAAEKAAAPEPEFEEDTDDGEDEPEADDEPEAEEDDEEVVYDEETLRALPFGALRAVAREFGVSTKGKSADDIIEEILNSGEEVEDDDEPPF